LIKGIFTSSNNNTGAYLGAQAKNATYET
jgi:hypothetical protein